MTVTVDDGTAAGTDTVLVMVNAVNATPVVNAGADATIDEGGTFTSSGSFTDPDTDTWTATVDYGDGSGVEWLPLAGKTFSLSHTYTSRAGSPYTVTVDDGTAAGTDTVLVTVKKKKGGGNSGGKGGGKKK